MTNASSTPKKPNWTLKDAIRLVVAIARLCRYVPEAEAAVIDLLHHLHELFSSP